MNFFQQYLQTELNAMFLIFGIREKRFIYDFISYKIYIAQIKMDGHIKYYFILDISNPLSDTDLR